MMFNMMKVLEEAIEKVKTLSEERQALAAEVLKHIAASEDGVFHVPDEHRAAVLEGLAQAKRGEFADDATVERVLRKPWG
jgi:uncharacterized protein YehS (DUF1456 family)